jgi:hypothetical protein
MVDVVRVVDERHQADSVVDPEVGLQTGGYSTVSITTRPSIQSLVFWAEAGRQM